MPIIILEGVDGAGKSTLAKKIAALSPLPVRLEHRGEIKSTPEEEYIKPLMYSRDDELIIADRWHVGEMIYGPIYRGKSLVAGDYNRIIEGLLDTLGAAKVILSPSLKVVRNRLAKRGEDYLQPNDVAAVHAFYETYAEMPGWRKVSKVTRSTAQEILDKALGGAR